MAHVLLAFLALATLFARPAAGFECRGCRSQTFTANGMLHGPSGGTAFALLVGGGAGGAKLGGGASGVATSGIFSVTGRDAVTVGAGGAGFSTGGTVGYNAGDNNLADDVSGADGSPSTIGSLVAAGGDGEEADMGGVGTGGSGGGHYGTPRGNPGGSGGADGSGGCCFGVGQGAQSFEGAIDVTGLQDLEFSAGAGGDGGWFDNPGAEAGGGGGGGVLVNGGGPTAAAAEDGVDGTTRQAHAAVPTTTDWTLMDAAERLRVYA